MFLPDIPVHHLKQPFQRFRLRQLFRRLVHAAQKKMYYVISYLQRDAVTDEIPNAETIAAIEELDKGGGTLFSDSTEKLFAQLLKD